VATVLVPLSRVVFDPTEAAVPWRVFVEAGHDGVFATPDARPARADPRMLHGTDLGWLAPLLRAQAGAVAGHDRMRRSAAWSEPIAWSDIVVDRFDAVLFALGRPVAAICRGTVLAARSRVAVGANAGRSVL
jgi:protease I